MATSFPSCEQIKANIAEFVGSTRQSIACAAALQTSEDAEVAIRAQEERKSKLLSELKGNMSELEKKIQAVEDQKNLIQESNGNVVNLQKLQTVLLQTLDNVKADIEEFDSKSKKSREDAVKKLEKAKEQHAFLKNLSALEIHATKDKSVVFTFTEIHPDVPDKKYSVKMKLIGNSYTANVSVPIPGFKEMVHDLNKTNDLRQFLADVRKKFVASRK